MSTFTNKTLMITGGTGSFGNAVLNRFLKQILERFVFFHEMKRSRMTCDTISRRECQK